MADEKFDLEVLKEKPVLVYGAGCVAKPMIKMLGYLKVNLIGVAVTSVSDNYNEYAGFKIKCIKDWKNYSEDSVVLIATSRRYFEEITKECNTTGFKNVIPLTPELNNIISMCCYKKYFSSLGISYNDKIITIGNGKYINPIFQLENGVKEFEGKLQEMVDFVVPSIMNDYTFIDEGLYEYGNVDLKIDDVVLDLGANVGYFSVLAASKGCVSYAFEPTPSQIPIIKRHSELNGDRIYAEQYAISNQGGETTFYLDNDILAANSLIVRGNQGSSITVNQITVDDFVKQKKLERVDFIKADIEGAERLMLEGATETLKRFAPKLSLCTYHLPDDKEVLTDLILKTNPNYKIEYKWEKLYAHV